VVNYADVAEGEVNKDKEYDPYPEGNWIHDNTLDHNGYDPTGAAQIAASMGKVPQIFWDGKFDDSKSNDMGAKTNCFGDNMTSDDKKVTMERPTQLDECKDSPNSSFCMNQCKHEAGDKVELPSRVTDMAKIIE